MKQLTRTPPPDVVGRIGALHDEAAREAARSLGSPYTASGATTFLYVGGADGVAPEHFMAMFPPFPAMRQMGTTDVWECTVRLPSKSRVEYKLAVRHGDATSHVLDGLNPHTATDPFGENSVAFGPGYVEPWWTGVREGELAGTIRREWNRSSSLGGRRRTAWYLPPVSFRHGGMSLVVVHDGSDFLAHAGAATAIDNLTVAGAIAPALYAFVDPVDRNLEYVDDPRHAEFISEVIASGVKRHGASPDRSDHYLVGASLGAIASLSTAWRSGGEYGGLALMSGSFVRELGGPHRRGPSFTPVVAFVEEFTAAPISPGSRVYVCCGAYEALAADNRAFLSVLKGTGAAVLYEEPRDGHHWHAWRDRLGDALTFLLPGPDPAAASTVPG